MIDANNWLDVLSNSLMPRTKAKKLDLTKKEDYESFCEMTDSLRKNLGEISPFMRAIFGDAFTSTIDELESSAKEIYNNAHTPVDSTRKVVDNTVQEPNEPEKPSSKTPEEMQAKINKIVDEYVDTMIRPYADANSITEECINNAHDGLFEFACWIYMR